jgi:S-formylglutathione hydrolase FrmB
MASASQTGSSQLAQLLGTRGEVHVDFVDSLALHGNPLGDPSRRTLLVYTPPGYDTQGSRRYPVLYCLPAFMGSAAGMISTRPWEHNVIEYADRLVASGKMAPLILVVVDGFTRLGGSQYVDSVHNGDYATYVVRDVVGHVDAHYRSIAREGGRAVFGKSSGGFGAIHLTMKHPGAFCAFASHSGDAYFRGIYPQGFPHAFRTLERYGFDLAAFVSDFEGKNKRAPQEYATMEILGYAAAYSPRAGEAFTIDLPFDQATGEMRDDVFSRWLSYDPVERVPRSSGALSRLRLRYLDCGSRDEYGLDIGARVLVKRLRDAGLDVRHEEFDDGHRNTAYRYEVSLPALAGVLDTE